jgi:hypothetical protein
MTSMLVLGSSGKVVIGHHFLFDMCTPFQPASSNQFIMLTGKHTMDNAVMIDPAAGLAFPDNAPPICYPTWAMLSAAVDGPARIVPLTVVQITITNALLVCNLNFRSVATLTVHKIQNQIK